jgi:hypothetical protein
MTRSYRLRNRITQPIPVVVRRRLRDPAIDDRSFTCFRLVPEQGALQPIELVHSTARMFVFTSL